MKDFYETSRLILRYFRMGDEQALYELLSNPDVNRFLPMFPLQSVEEAKDYLQTHYLDLLDIFKSVVMRVMILAML